MTKVGESTKVSAFSVFRNRNFTLLWSGQLVSTIGNSLTSLAASILVYRLTGSALSVGLMLMATVIPTLFVGLIAGVFADRYDRRRLMIASDVIRALLVLLIPFLVPYSIVWLYVLIMLTSAVGQFFAPAEESLLPDVASEEQLGAANSMLAISSFGSTAIGFAAAGFIASAASIEWAFYLDALTFLVSAACILPMRVPSFVVDEDTNVKVVVRNLKAGLKYLVDSPILRSLVIVSVPIMVSFGLWNTLLLPFAIEALGATEFEFGVQEGLTSVGFVVGSLLMAGLVDRLREGQWMALSWLGMGILGVLYAGASSIPVAFVLVTLSGFLNAPSSIGRRLVLQRYTEREVRGRVASAYFVSRDVLFLVGMGLAGVADFVDVRWMMLAAAILMLFGGALAVVLPGLRQPAAQWRRAVSLLRSVPLAPGLEVGRAAVLADLNRYAARTPAFAELNTEERKGLLRDMTYIEAPAGTLVLRYGEVSDAAYLILEGKAVAGREEDGRDRVLEVLRAGDFFGEIAALTAVPRTANVMIEEDASLLQVPAATLREMAGYPALNRAFVTKMTERMIRMNMIDMPRVATLDQQALRDLRRPEVQPQAATAST